MTRYFKVHGMYLERVGLDPVDGQVFPVLRHECCGGGLEVVTLRIPGNDYRVDRVDTKCGEFLETIRGYDHGLNIDTVAGDTL